MKVYDNPEIYMEIQTLRIDQIILEVEWKKKFILTDIQFCHHAGVTEERLDQRRARQQAGRNEESQGRLGMWNTMGWQTCPQETGIRQAFISF